jgi:response regulator of citrate/malate metabolism
MPRLFDRPDDRKKMLNSLIVLRSKLQTQPAPQDVANDSLSMMHQKMDEVLIKLKELDGKIEGVKRERITDFIDKDKPFRKSESKEGPKKMKVKGMVRSLIEQHGRLTAEDLSRMLRMSRTRCSEYLKEFERAGVLSGETVRRKRFYSIAGG